MSLKVLSSNKNLIFNKKLNLFLSLNRNGHWLRGKPPGVASSLADRLKKEYSVDEIESKLKDVNIGFPRTNNVRSGTLKQRLEYLKSIKTEELQNRAQFKIDLNAVNNDSIETTWPFQLKKISEHYGIYKDLFGRAYFIPRILLTINYKDGDKILHPVYNGNIILPESTKNLPEIKFNGNLDIITLEESKETNYWSILLVNLDGNYTSKSQEHIHWFISNIPNSDIAKGQTVVPYLQPFPPKGIGCQRFVFVLYKQNQVIDFSKYAVQSENVKNIKNYSFNTFEFYRDHQNDITPASLSFFQSKWDKSVIEFNKNHLKYGKQATFEYDFPKPYLSEQKWFPLKQPFDIYMDKHNEAKTKLYQVKSHLKTVHPFKVPEYEIKFPNAIPIKNVPSWLKTKMKKDRLGIGRINDIKNI